MEGPSYVNPNSPNVKCNGFCVHKVLEFFKKAKQNTAIGERTEKKFKNLQRQTTHQQLWAGVIYKLPESAFLAKRPQQLACILKD